MQEWTQWFRAQQSDFGTVEDFARASGIKVRSVADYRSGRIPRGKNREAIARVLGTAGPLPGTPTQRAAKAEYLVSSQLAELRALHGDLTEYYHKLRVRMEHVEATLDDAATREEVRVLRDLLQKLVDDQGNPRGSG